MARKNSLKLWLWLVGLIGTPLAICGGAFYVGVGSMDVAPAARDLDRAAAEYKKAGLPWEAKDLVPHVDESNNAAPDLEDALAIWKAVPRDPKADPVKMARASNWPELRTYVERYRMAMASAERAAHKSGLDFHRDWDIGPDLLFPEFADIKEIVKLFCVRAQLKISSGDVAGAVSDLKSAQHLSGLVSQEPTIIGLLVSLAGQSITLRAVQDCAVLAVSSPQALEQLASVTEYKLPDFGYALRGEAYNGLSLMRNFSRYGGLRAVLRKYEGTNTAPGAQSRESIVRTGLPSELWSRAFLDHNMRFWIDVKHAVDLSPQDPERIGKAMDDAAFRQERSKTWSGKLDEILMPVFAQAGSAIISLKANQVTTRALLMALKIRQATGQFPHQIEDLPGKWVDPFTSGPLKLKFGADSIRIYSVGPDRKDDEGRTRSERKGGSYDIVAAYPPIRTEK